MKNYEIKLEDYCENCPEFEVKVEEKEKDNYEIINVASMEREVIYILHRTLTCKHYKRCANMYRNKFEKMSKEDFENVEQ